jgi:hypothetical protein
VITVTKLNENRVLVTGDVGDMFVNGYVKRGETVFGRPFEWWLEQVEKRGEAGSVYVGDHELEVKL